MRGPMVSGLAGVVSVFRVCWNGRPPVSGLPFRLAIFRRWIVSFGYIESTVRGLGCCEVRFPGIGRVPRVRRVVVRVGWVVGWVG